MDMTPSYGYGRVWVPPFIEHVETTRPVRVVMLCRDYRCLSQEDAHDIISEKRDYVAHHPHPENPYKLYESSIRFAGLKHCFLVGRWEREAIPRLQRLSVRSERYAELLDAQYEHQELLAKLQQALVNLPENGDFCSNHNHCRLVAKLLLEQKTPREIAAIVPMSLQVVYQTIYKIIRHLAILL